MNHPLATIGDVLSLGALAGAYLGYLPDIAAGIAAIWYLIHIIEWLRGKTKID